MIDLSSLLTVDRLEKVRNVIRKVITVIVLEDSHELTVKELSATLKGYKC